MKPARVAAILAVALALVLGAIFLNEVKAGLEAFLAWIQGIGAWGPPLLSVVYVLACVLFLPGSILTLGAGFLFGLWKGLLAVIVGSNLGAWAAFALGRTLMRGWVASKVSGNARFAAVDEAVGREGFKIVLLTRLSPVFPFNLLNFAFGATRVSFRDYALGSFIGMLPGTVMYVYFGTAGRSLAEVAAGRIEGGVAGKTLLWFGLAAAVAVTLLVTRAARQALRKELPDA